MSPVIIARITLALYIPAAHSLKEKRTVVQRLKNRLRHRFNLAVSETGNLDKWQRAELTAVLVGTDRNRLTSQVQKILAYCEQELLGRAEILRSELGWF